MLAGLSLGTDTGGGSIRIHAALNPGWRGSAIPRARCPAPGVPLSGERGLQRTHRPLARRTVAGRGAHVHEIIAGHDAPAITTRIRSASRSISTRAAFPGCASACRSLVLRRRRIRRSAALVRAAIGTHARGLQSRRPPVDLPEGAGRAARADADGAAPTRPPCMPGTCATRPRNSARHARPGCAEGRVMASQQYADGMRLLRSAGRAGWSRPSIRSMSSSRQPALWSPRPGGRFKGRTRNRARFPLRTRSWALAGTPALSVPVGFAANGLPAAMQLVAPRWRDARVLALGARYRRRRIIT